MPELFRERAASSVACNLIMFRSLRGGNHAGVQHLGRRILLEEIIALLGKSLHAFAKLASRALAKHITYLLKPGDVALRLHEMLFKPGPQVRRGGCPGHLRKRLEHDVLR